MTSFPESRFLYFYIQIVCGIAMTYALLFLDKQIQIYSRKTKLYCAVRYNLLLISLKACNDVKKSIFIYKFII
jgi:hypothetical protein